MLTIHEQLNQQEQQALEEMRSWANSQGDTNEHITVAGKLSIAQRLLDSANIGTKDTWKSCAIGVLLGDALHQATEKRLAWVVADDEFGPSFALSWKHSEALVYPLSAIRSRLAESAPISIYDLFAEYSTVFPFQQR